MNSSNSDSHSGTSASKKLKNRLYKYYPRFSKVYKQDVHLNQFLVLSYDYLSNI